MVGALIRSGRFDWQRVLARLKAADIKRLRAKLPEYEAESVLAALQVSVEELPEREQRAFRTCAVLPEDVAVPEAALLTLWSEIYDDEEDARDAAQLFVERSLMSRDEARRYRLHDLYHDYLRAECADLPAAHGRFVEAYRQQCPNGWASGPDDGYFFRHLPMHLEQAGRGDELRDLLLDYHWIKAKLAATDVPALLADYAQTADAGRGAGRPRADALGACHRRRSAPASGADRGPAEGHRQGADRRAGRRGTRGAGILLVLPAHALANTARRALAHVHWPRGFGHGGGAAGGRPARALRFSGPDAAAVGPGERRRAAPLRRPRR